MSEIKDENQKDISIEYTTKLYHEESMISGFLLIKIKRIRNLMKAGDPRAGNRIRAILKSKT
jgi:hypothetical protein